MTTYLSGPLTFLLLSIVAGCGPEENIPSVRPENKQPPVTGEPAQPTPETGTSDATEPQPTTPQEPEGRVWDGDRCVIAKTVFGSGQCIIASLKGYEAEGSDHEGTIRFQACKIVERSTLDSTIFLGEYDVRAAGYPGDRRSLAQLSIYAGDKSLLDHDQSERIGTLTITKVDVDGSRAIEGELEVSTDVDSELLTKRHFKAHFLGYFLDTIGWPNPDIEAGDP